MLIKEQTKPYRLLSYNIFLPRGGHKGTQSNRRFTKGEISVPPIALEQINL